MLGLILLVLLLALIFGGLGYAVSPLFLILLVVLVLVVGGGYGLRGRSRW